MTGEDTKVCLLSGFWSFGHFTQFDRAEVRLFSFTPFISRYYHQMAAYGRFHDHRVLWWDCLRVADGDRASRSGFTGSVFLFRPAGRIVLFMQV